MLSKHADVDSDMFEMLFIIPDILKISSSLYDLIDDNVSNISNELDMWDLSIAYKTREGSREGFKLKCRETMSKLRRYSFESVLDTFLWTKSSLLGSISESDATSTFQQDTKRINHWSRMMKSLKDSLTNTSDPCLFNVPTSSIIDFQDV